MRRAEPVMGTVASVVVEAPDDDKAVAAAVDAVFGLLRWVDRTFTTFDETSVIRRLGRGEFGEPDCPEPVREVAGGGGGAHAKTAQAVAIRKGGGRIPTSAAGRAPRLTRRGRSGFFPPDPIV